MYLLTQTHQLPKIYSECLAVRAMNVGIRSMSGVLGAVGGPLGAAVALACAPDDAFGGGINPMSNATGFSAYFSVNNSGYSADPGATAGDISTWMTKAFDNSSFRNKVVSTLNSIGKTLG